MKTRRSLESRATYGTALLQTLDKLSPRTYSEVHTLIIFNTNADAPSQSFSLVCS